MFFDIYIKALYIFMFSRIGQKTIFVCLFILMYLLFIFSVLLLVS